MSKIIKNSIDYKDKRSISYLSQHAIMDKEGNIIDETYSKNNDVASFMNKNFNTSNILNNAGFHNSIFRGKWIQDKYLDGSLYTSISNGTFDDLYVGDYFTASINGSDVECRIAGFDLFYGIGDNIPLSFHHAVIVPDEPLMTAVMNNTNTTSGGYANSKMYTTTIPIIDGYLDYTFNYPPFFEHLIPHQQQLSKGVTDYEASSGNAGVSGCSHDWGWYNGSSWLMSEVEVYGTMAFSSSGYDIASGKTQFPLFKLAPQFINPGRYSWWLRSVFRSTAFCCVSDKGTAGSNGASTNCGVRPFWLIGNM